MTSRERAQDIRTRMVRDMERTLVKNGVPDGIRLAPELAEDAMFQVEHLLAEVQTLEETLTAERRAGQ